MLILYTGQHHRRSVTRNFRGAQSNSQIVFRSTAIRTVTIFSLSYRKILKFWVARAPPPSEASKIIFGGGGLVPPKMYGRTTYGQQINSQLYTANERAELRKEIETMLLSYGLTYKQERIEQHTAQPY